MLPWPQDVALARSVEVLPGGRSLPGGCLYEPKWDGFRAVLHMHRVEGRTVCRVQSRHGADLTGAFPDIVAAAEAQVPPGTVVDGEVVIWGGERLDFTALQRRLASPARATQLARERPASFVAFDLLAHDGQLLTDQPLRERRRRLDGLLPVLSPPLQICPATRDPAVAAQWLSQYADADVGIEGLVIKGLAERYQPGRRAWLKLRTRSTVEAIVGAITGTLARPDRLVLGLYDRGVLIVAGGTAPLHPAQQREVSPLLKAMPAGEEHPWPPELPSGRTGVFGGPRRLPVLLVRPQLVVEIGADSAFEYSKWRHLTRYVRLRPDLDPRDVQLPSH
ncbi:MAG TPA: ATP-dependent DNA ligase [Kineosporiaceae bacterium]|nr:ATP-dependent DNA ligase [Kineosporiaceae bacterium]